MLDYNDSLIKYGNPNAMDLMSDQYANSGMSNMGGLSYGQSLGGGNAAAPQQSWQDFLFGTQDKTSGLKTMGAAMPLVQGASALMNGFMGMKQYGLSKKIFENNKQQFERNFGAQKGITNSQLEDKFTRQNNDMVANGIKPTRSAKDSMELYGVK